MLLNSVTERQSSEYIGIFTKPEPAPVIITRSISPSASPFSDVKRPSAPYTDVTGSVACTNIGESSLPSGSKPTIFVVLPPTSMPTIVFPVLFFIFLHDFSAIFLCLAEFIAIILYHHLAKKSSQ